MNQMTYSFGNYWRIPASLPPPTFLTMEAVAEPVARAHGYSLTAIRSRARYKSISEARFEVVWALRAQRNRHGEPRWSLPQIGRFLGRDHTSILHALRQRAKRLAQQQEAA